MRNKAAEKAKHAHHQQQAQQQAQQQQQNPSQQPLQQNQQQESASSSVSVIAHAPAGSHPVTGAIASNAYSISGILGIPTHHQDSNDNNIKRKRRGSGKLFVNIIPVLTICSLCL